MIQNKQILKGLEHYQYEHPFDKVALEKLEKIPFLKTACEWITSNFIERIYNVQYTGSHLKVTKDNYPKIYQYIEDACRILDLKRVPELYCEKISDCYRIGNIKDGINWKLANEQVQQYYQIRSQRCTHCSAVRMCDLCLTAIEFSDEQWDALCHNEREYARLYMFLFCEMAERGMIDNGEFPTLQIKEFVLDKITEKDVQPMMEIFADKETKRFMPELTEAIREER